MAWGIERTVAKPGGHRLRCGLQIGLLILMVGCVKNPHAVEHAEVSGKVLYQGKALPGGIVTFISVNGGFAASADIDQDGNYQLKPPVGEVEISVTNRMFRSNRGTKGPALPKKAETSKSQSLKGHYVEIPSVYEDPRTSGLKYTVTPGSQTFNIELSANASKAPSDRGS
jgi:hypothetical protein